jgi:hypothetical protein
LLSALVNFFEHGRWGSPVEMSVDGQPSGPGTIGGWDSTGAYVTVVLATGESYDFHISSVQPTDQQ